MSSVLQEKIGVAPQVVRNNPTVPRTIGAIDRDLGVIDLLNKDKATPEIIRDYLSGAQTNLSKLRSQLSARSDEKIEETIEAASKGLTRIISTGVGWIGDLGKDSDPESLQVQREALCQQMRETSGIAEHTKDLAQFQLLQSNLLECYKLADQYRTSAGGNDSRISRIMNDPVLKALAHAATPPK